MYKTLLVIPCYNDSERLSSFLESLVVSLPNHFTICISDDGSSAKEREALDKLILKNQKDGLIQISIYREPLNKGKGHAIRMAWEHKSRDPFDILAFADADGSISASEIIRMDKIMQDNSEIDALYSSRTNSPNKTISRSFLRTLTSKVFAKIVNIALNLNIKDIQCGAKFIRKEVYLRVKGVLVCERYCLDSELALALRSKNYNIRQEPISWVEMPSSKMNIPRDAPRMLKEIVNIKLRSNSYR